MTSGAPSLKLAVTGATGVLCRAVFAQGPQIEWLRFQGDIRAKADVEAWVQACVEGRVDGFLHFAAIVPTQQIETDLEQAIQTNVVGTAHLTAAIAQARKATTQDPWLFLASSSHVYASSGTPLGEDAPIAPISMYGLTKLQAEQWSSILAAKYDLRLCIGRIFSYSSALQAKSFFLPSIVEKIRTAPANGTLEIPGLDGRRDFLSADDVAKGILFLAEQAATGVFNVASGKALLLGDIVETVRRRLKRLDVSIRPPGGSNKPVHLLADVGKLRALGHAPAFHLEHLVDEIIATHH